MIEVPTTIDYATLDEQWQPKLDELLNRSQERLSAVGNTAVDETKSYIWLEALDDALQINLEMIDTAAREHFGDYYDQWKAAYLITNNPA